MPKYCDHPFLSERARRSKQQKDSFRTQKLSLGPQKVVALKTNAFATNGFLSSGITLHTASTSIWAVQEVDPSTRRRILRSRNPI